MNTKNNQRYQETDQKIRQCFLDFLQEKKISQITVRDICESVGLNRSSFYAHYADVYALMDAICHDIGVEIIVDLQALPQPTVPFLNREYILVVIRHIYRHQDFFRSYLSGTGTPEIERIMNYLFEAAFIPFFQRIGVTSETQMRYHFDYFEYGLLGVLRRWLGYGCPESPEELTDLIWRTITQGPDSI